MGKIVRDNLYTLLNLLEELEDVTDYDKYYTPFNKIISRDKKALVNTDREEAELIKLVRAYIRESISVGTNLLTTTKEEPQIEILPVVTETKSIDLSKAYSWSQFERWNREINDKLGQVRQDFTNKMVIPVSVSYGKGFEKAMEDVGVKPNTNWMYIDVHMVPRLKNLLLLQHISDDLQLEMRTAIVDGIRAGEGTSKIAKRLRSVQDTPKHVVVPPKIDPKTGMIIRKGYEYDISSKRYSEIIARTETSKAVNMGRIDSYTQSGVVKNVEVLTAGDNRVCPICEPLDRQIFSLTEAEAVIPIHPQCRCTWTIHDYKGDEEDKEKIQERYEVDDISKVVNTSPIGVPEGIIQTTADILRYKNHLKHFGLDNSKGHAKVYSKIKQQLRGLGVESFEGWKFGQFDNIYALHNIKNSRFLLQRNIKTKLPKIKTLRYEKVISNDKNLLGQTSGLNTKKYDITFANSGIYNHCYRTTIHEQSHTIYREYIEQLNFKARHEWEMLHRSSKLKYITNYAKVNEVEDFCEVLTFMNLDPSKVKRICPEKYKFMQEYVMKSI